MLAPLPRQNLTLYSMMLWFVFRCLHCVRLPPSPAPLPAEFNMMVFSGTRSVEYQQDMLNAGEYSRDGWSCTPFQSTTLPPVGHTPAVVVSLVFCAGFDGVAVRSGGDVADINATVIINATVTVKDTGALLGVIPVWSVSFQQPDNECVMLPEVYTLIVTCVLCAIVPFATFFLWPLPNPDTEPADGKAEKEEEGKQQIITLGSINAGEEAVVAASLARPSRLAKLVRTCHLCPAPRPSPRDWTLCSYVCACVSNSGAT